MREARRVPGRAPAQDRAAGGGARAATPDLEVWIARFGRVVERKPNAQFDILYEDMVNAIRAEIPQNVHFIPAKAASIATGSERQHLTLSTGEEISARLIVLANGLNIGLRHNVGIEREVVSPCHSISIGFDLEPVGRSNFDFRALTYYPEAPDADGLSDAVSDRLGHARQSLRLSRHA